MRPSPAAEFPSRGTRPPRRPCARRSTGKRCRPARRHARAFAGDAWSAFLDIGPTGDFCTPWPISQQPAAPAGPGFVYPSTPDLVLSGEYDLLIPNEQAQAVAARFPGSQFVVIAKTGHQTLPFNGCAQGMVGEFIETGGPVDSSCSTSFAPGYAVGRFPLKAADAVAARVDPGARDASTTADRRIATAAWSAAYDALQQGFVGPPEGTAFGLRGGHYRYRFDGTRDKVVLSGVRFTTDVAVSGLTGYEYATGTTKTLLNVTMDGRHIGRLRSPGTLPHVESLTVRGASTGTAWRCSCRPREWATGSCPASSAARLAGATA
jgi:hypothetical protein